MNAEFSRETVLSDPQLVVVKGHSVEEKAMRMLWGDRLVKMNSFIDLLSMHSLFC